MKLLERFLKYVSFDTQSDPDSETYPSTPGQLTLLKYLADELRELGVSDVRMDGFGYVTGHIPATLGREQDPAIGFLAHVDTSPDASGTDVKPRLTEKDGDTVISTDGTTLLGADDKAGVAEIVTAAAYLLAHPEIAHNKMCIGFTPDEEVGRGVDHFDVKAFGADFAYTMDGGPVGELEFENFNAASACISIEGLSAHPGDAKGKMRNAVRVAVELDGMLPASERPETTAGYEGFFHLMHIDGGVERARVEYIIRDHSRERFEERKKFIAEAVAAINAKYGEGTATVEVSDSYYNMREVVERYPRIVERAASAMREAGIEPRIKPIRGGTDGARLSFIGLPCPNIFAGGVNFHSRKESISLSAMQKAVEVIIGIVRG